MAEHWFDRLAKRMAAGKQSGSHAVGPPRPHAKGGSRGIRPAVDPKPYPPHIEPSVPDVSERGGGGLGLGF